jgi:hypothetical protein
MYLQQKIFAEQKNRVVSLCIYNYLKSSTALPSVSEVMKALELMTAHDCAWHEHSSCLRIHEL